MIPTSSTPTRAFPGFFQAIALIVFCILLVYEIDKLARGFLASASLSSPQISAVCGAVAAALTVVFAVKHQRLTLRKVFHQTEASSRRELILLTLAALMLVPFLNLVVLPYLISGFQVDHSAGPETLRSLALGEPIFLLFPIAIDPLLEEMIFRGIILRGFLTRYPPWVAILASSLLFGAVHLSPPQIVSATTMGILCSYLYFRTRSVIPGLALHVFWNGFVLTVTRSQHPNFFDKPWATALAAIVAAGGAALFYRLAKEFGAHFHPAK